MHLEGVSDSKLPLGELQDLRLIMCGVGGPVPTAMKMGHVFALEGLLRG